MAGNIRAIAVVTAASLLLCDCAVQPGGGAAGPGGELHASQSQACQYDYAASTGLGMGIGAGIGALAGGRDRGTNAALGALAGGIAALLLTSYLEQRCRALALAKAQMQTLQMTTNAIDISGAGLRGKEAGIEVAANGDQMFASASAELTGAGRHDMEAIAEAFRGSGRHILIVGHTDASESSEAAQLLSEKRAEAVARLFAARGIAPNRLYYKGAGETQPLASNRTAEGRARNRRVEVVELVSQEGILAFDGLAESSPSALRRAAPLPRPAQVAAVTTVPAPARRKPAPAPSAKPGPTAAPSARPVIMAATRKGTRFDFGGEPVDTAGTPIRALVGANSEPGSPISFISTAFAAEKLEAAPETACVADRYKPAGAVRSLATGQPVVSKIRDHVPGLYGTSWSDTENGHLVGMTQISVMRDTGAVDADPQLFVYLNYKDGDKASMAAHGQARAYVGDKGTLYRVFFPAQSWPIRCMDLVFPRQNVQAAVYGRVYYEKNDGVYAAKYMPRAIVTGQKPQGL